MQPRVLWERWVTCTDAIGREREVMVAVIAEIADPDVKAATDTYRLVAVAPGGGSVSFTVDQVKEAEQYLSTIGEGVAVLKLLRERRDKRGARRKHGKRGPQS